MNGIVINCPETSLLKNNHIESQHRAMEVLNAEDIQCEWLVNPSRNTIKAVWLAIEPYAPRNVFLSWHWISTWFDTFVNSSQSRTNGLLVAKRGQHLIGAGIFVAQHSRNILGQKTTRYSLHRVGDELSDQIWIEYNDFLMVEDHQDVIRQAMMVALQTHIRSRDAVQIGVSLPSQMIKLEVSSTKPQFEERLIWHSPSYQVDLQQLRQQQCGVMQSLSKNARKQIKRSMNKYQQRGVLLLETANSGEQALEWFDAAKVNHIARWGAKPEQSGFANDKFVQFHHQYISKSFAGEAKALANSAVQLHRLKVGEQILGYIYNLHFGDTVYFYLSALSYEDDPQLKPGLVAHALLIEQAYMDGKAVYDFMGGEARYKQTFSNHKSELLMKVYFQPHFALTVENGARRVYSGLKQLKAFLKAPKN
ncbi:hypothetical protein A3K86_20625 [Photobacterium jeanii]|uniref:BioF2-like acetyltransferase domain-containing protein n=2 Tax=Photobacterium jeanii TaxID=858640 RepID=A0A178K2M1_9GAMM|nr:hypothetical protein A3K86_20625 [Photobacterium jeanii]